MRAIVALGGLALLGGWVVGFSFDQDALGSAGGGGIAFTGAPRWANHGCDVCHTNAPHKIGIQLEADDPSVFTMGWQPAKQYHLRVEMIGETLGLAYRNNGAACQNDGASYKPCDNNGFGLELDGDTAQPAGTFAYVDAAGKCTPTKPAVTPIYIMAGAGGAVLQSGENLPAANGETAWDVCWTAPAAGAGTITAYMSLVDGNGGNGTDKFVSDVTGDDVATGAVPLPERANNGATQMGGCNAGGDASILVGVALAIALRRRKRALVGAALVASLAAGCVHVRPRQREVLARKNMQFGPDPAEDELDLHMQEAREGSTGGYGSSGGGCGCN